MTSPRIIATYTIGNSATDDAKRRVGWNLESLQWSGFVARHVARCRAEGYAAIELHNPFGTKANEEMLASQFNHAKRERLHWLTDGFEEAWKPVVQGGMEVIAYAGSLKLDPEMIELAKSSGPPFREYLMQAYGAMVGAGCSLGFDSHHFLPAQSWEHVALRRMMTWVWGINPAARAYIEPMPHQSDAAWFSQEKGVMSKLNIWLASHNDLIACEERGLPRPPWALDPIPADREIVVHLTRHPTLDTPQPFADWGPDFIRRQLAKGRSVAVPPHDLQALGMTPRDFV